jgi:hypothetical protein
LRPEPVKQGLMNNLVMGLAMWLTLDLLSACSSNSGTTVGTGGATGVGGANDTGGTSSTGGASDASAGSDAGDASARCLAEEPADMASLVALSAWTDLPTLRSGKYVQVTSTDRETMVFPTMPPGHHDFNNYDCRGQESVVPGGGDTGPLFIDSPACPEDYVKGLVAARFEGSGHLVRFWATGLDSARLSVSDAILRLYVDDQPEPCIEVKIGDAKTPPASLDIFAFPFGANTSNNLAWYYPVAFSKKLVISIDNVPNNLTWYQASVVLDEMPTVHERATAKLPARDMAKAVLNSVASPVPHAIPLAAETAFSLPSNTTVTVVTLSGPATVTASEFACQMPPLPYLT